MVSDSVPPKWSAKMSSPLTRPNTGRHDYLDATCGAVPAGPRGARPRSAPHARSCRSPGAVGPPGPPTARGLPLPWSGSLVHGNRGRPAPNRIADALRARIVALATTTYADVNHTHLTELLAEREGIVLSRPSVRRILRAAGLRSPHRRRPPRHRRRRERRPQEG